MFSKLKKRLTFIFTILLITVLFTGCNNVKLSSDIKINSNGSTDSKIRIYYDETICKLVNNDLFTKLLDDSAAYYKINKYTEGSYYIEEIDISTDKIDLKNLASTSSAMSTSINEAKNFFDYNISEKKGFLTNIYTFNLSLNKDILGTINSSLKNELDNNLNQYISSDFSSLISNGISDNATKYIETIPYELTITTPVDIIDSNATTQLDKRTLYWKYTLSDLDENTELMVSFKLPNIINIATLLGIGLFIIIIIITIIIVKKKRTNNK